MEIYSISRATPGFLGKKQARPGDLLWNATAGANPGRPPGAFSAPRWDAHRRQRSQRRPGAGDGRGRLGTSAFVGPRAPGSPSEKQKKGGARFLNRAPPRLRPRSGWVEPRSRGSTPHQPRAAVRLQRPIGRSRAPDRGSSPSSRFRVRRPTNPSGSPNRRSG